LGFACSCFLGVWDVALSRLFEIFLSFYALLAINYPLRIAFEMSHRFRKVIFSFT
jgi:hypothetical protein